MDSRSGTFCQTLLLPSLPSIDVDSRLGTLLQPSHPASGPSTDVDSRSDNRMGDIVGGITLLKLQFTPEKLRKNQAKFAQFRILVSCDWASQRPNARQQSYKNSATWQETGQTLWFLVQMVKRWSICWKFIPDTNIHAHDFWVILPLIHPWR